MSATRRAAAAAIAATMAWTIAGTAYAEPTSDASSTHIYIDDEFVFAEPGPNSFSTDSSEVDLGPSPGYELDPSLLPSEGETVVVHYINATETITAPTASCTQSATASTPRKANNRAYGEVNLKRSSGCSGTWQGNGQMNFKNRLGLWASGGSSSTHNNLIPGSNVSKQWSTICKGTRTTGWVTLAAMWYQALETSSKSRQANLACTA